MTFYFTLPKFQMSHVTGLQKVSLMFVNFYFTLPNFQVSHVTWHKPSETVSLLNSWILPSEILNVTCHSPPETESEV